jgi:hypothetical protein
MYGRAFSAVTSCWGLMPQAFIIVLAAMIVVGVGLPVALVHSALTTNVHRVG